jgi:hypothetical protein
MSSGQELFMTSSPKIINEYLRHFLLIKKSCTLIPLTNTVIGLSAFNLWTNISFPLKEEIFEHISAGHPSGLRSKLTAKAVASIGNNLSERL